VGDHDKIAEDSHPYALINLESQKTLDNVKVGEPNDNAPNSNEESKVQEYG
jgi:hypothetical protein